MERYVKIKVKELKELLEAEVKLNALECGGVDNWEWYGEAFSDYLGFDNKYDSWDELIENEYSEDAILEAYDEIK